MPKQFDPKDHEELPKSRTQIKLEAEALQKLGQRLTQLNAAQLEQIPMDDKLAQAVHEYQRLKKNEAKRRQGQYIGRIMRDTDAQALEDALNIFDASKTKHAQHFHILEKWRGRLLNDPQALTEFLQEFPETNNQQLRQLIRKTKKEKEQNKDLGASKKLFRLIRETIETVQNRSE